MTAYKFTSQRQLRDVLNNVERVQKANIDEYSWGHLNEKKLYKAPYNDTHGRFWKSSKKKKSSVKDKDLIPGLKTISSKHKSDNGSKMKEVLYDFSIGTMGGVPFPSPVKSTTLPKKEKVEEFRKETTDMSRVTEESRVSRSFRKDTASAKSLYSELDDGILVEQMPNQEMMVTPPRQIQNQYLPRKMNPSDPNYDVMQDLTQTLDIDGYLTAKHTFLPSFTTGITKTDQFNKLKEFETVVLRKQDTREQKVLSGMKAVQHLEKRLEEDLEMMNLGGVGPNFHKLQVYSNSFEDLIEETSTFGYMLKCIKSEYDGYITKLLDSQTPQHSRLLRDQVEQMSARGTSRPAELAEAKQRVATLEEAATEGIEENERLRAQVAEEEEWLANAPEPEPPSIPIISHFVDDTPVELADEIEHGKALILEKLDALTELRRKLRLEYVPLTVCTHLEQCIKETQIEVQKLLKQNEYFERSNNEMETELRDSIQDADTSERDARRIWKKVNSLKGLPRVNLSRNEGAVDDSDDEEDDETKWNWYIS
ncbi:uncharacterized protein LOC128236918 [Mya arenaria]|uniref:uncharacterized protein LOC128236918 n=1 Tax=Mya arenaria TaxID=6604 RepID=UPI0022E37D95|nr:uncharacterized protein LOC128236918 [Mya arenaria]XP_052808014.1 uncharacterized protein LOC128236918 [Mya arenaria]